MLFFCCCRFGIVFLVDESDDHRSNKDDTNSRICFSLDVVVYVVSDRKNSDDYECKDRENTDDFHVFEYFTECFSKCIVDESDGDASSKENNTSDDSFGCCACRYDISYTQNSDNHSYSDENNSSYFEK